MSDALFHRYDFIIQATPEVVFDALLDPVRLKGFYFGFDFVSEGTPGSTYELRNTKGDAQIAGVNEVVQKPEKLVQTFRFVNGEDPDSRVTWTLEAWGATGTLLTMVHDGFESETNTYKGVPGGWPAILSGLKTLLETGRELTYEEAE